MKAEFQPLMVEGLLMWALRSMGWVVPQPETNSGTC
jgi:hypothetical protein